MFKVKVVHPRLDTERERSIGWSEVHYGMRYDAAFATCSSSC